MVNVRTVSAVVLAVAVAFITGYSVRWLKLHREEQEEFARYRLVREGSIREVMDLVRGGFSPYAPMINGNDLVMNLASAGRLDALKMLRSNGFTLNYTNFGKIPLVSAAHSTNPEVVTYLIEQGNDPNFTGGFESPLVLAFSDDYSGRRTLVVRALLDNGADPNSPTQGGRSPLALAVFLGRTNIIPDLLKAGADPSAIDPLTKQPALYAFGMNPNRVERFVRSIERGTYD